MLWGALLTVLRMEKRPPETPTLRTSSFCCLRAGWPAKAEFWMAEVAMEIARFATGLKVVAEVGVGVAEGGRVSYLAAVGKLVDENIATVANLPTWWLIESISSI